MLSQRSGSLPLDLYQAPTATDSRPTTTSFRSVLKTIKTSGSKDLYDFYKSTENASNRPSALKSLSFPCEADVRNMKMVADLALENAKEILRSSLVPGASLPPSPVEDGSGQSKDMENEKIAWELLEGARKDLAKRKTWGDAIVEKVKCWVDLLAD